MGLASTAKLLAELGLVDKLTPGLKKVSGNLDKFDTRLGKVAGGAGKVSAGLARAGTIIAGAAVTGFSAAAKAAIDWEDAFAGVVKTVDETDLKSAGLTFDDLAESLRKMSLEMPNSAIELAGIAENAGALGIKAKDIEAFTRQVAILAATTDVSADDAATALGQLTNVIGLTGDEFDNFAAALVDLGNKGASTESQILEITRRAGAVAHNVGVAKDATLGWASATANLGFEAEAGGTALQKFFGLSQLNTTSKALQNMAAIAGGMAPEAFRKLGGAARKAMAGDFKKAFEKDATGTLVKFLRGLQKIPKAERLKTVIGLFGKGSNLTRLILGLSDSLDSNLIPSLETASTAWDDATAAQVEFEKRNATVKSAFARLKNGVIDAAVSIGEGFTPALGRASEKLATFLKDPANRAELQKIGEDIGKAIDAIDWDKVVAEGREFVGVLKTAFDWAKRIWDVFNSLPNEVKGATAGFLAINKLSGGLIAGGVGDIIGGLGGAVAKGAAGKVPGLGKLVAQPVFVTNWPVGGLGGAAGVGAGGGAGLMGKLTTGLNLLSIVSSVAAVVATQQEVSGASTAQAAAIKEGLDSSIAGKSLSELQTALAGVQTGIHDLSSNPLYALVQGDALDSLRSMEADLKAAIADKDPVQVAQETNRETRKGYALLSADNSKQKAALDSAKLAIDGAKRATEYGSSATQGAIRASTGAIVGAVVSHQPTVITNVKVNVSAAGVSKSVTEQRRYGPGNGSAGGGAGSGPGGAPSDVW